ncbi:helix-turn-helix transcriptional regulator [Aeromonas veronii]
MNQNATPQTYPKGTKRSCASAPATIKAKLRSSTTCSYHFLSLYEVLALIPVSKTTWYDGMKLGLYPQNYKLGRRRVAWRSCDIEDLMQKLVGGM